MSKVIFFVSLMLYITLFFNSQAISKPWYSENFDELKKGDLTPQDTWRNGAIASGTIQSKIIHGGQGQSLYIIENSGNQRTFEGGHAGLQYLAFWAYVPKEYPEGNLQIYTGAAAGDNKIAFFSRIYNNKRIAAHSGDKKGTVISTVDSKVTYSFEEWFHVRYVMDFDKQTYSLYVNNQLGAENVVFRGGAKEMSWLQMRWDHEQKLEIYIDEIELGDGKGEDAENWLGKKKSVSLKNKLTIKWGTIKDGISRGGSL